MSTYLIVAYQTVGGRPLRDAIDAIASGDGEAEFALLVPATRTQHLFTWTEGEARAVAESRAKTAAERLTEAGVRLNGFRVGDPDPFLAVSNELAANPGYAGVLVSTFPPGISRWLGRDLPSRLEKTFRVPITHVVVTPEEAESG